MDQAEKVPGQEETQAKLENAADFVRYFMSKFYKKFGVPYDVARGKDGQNMKRLLEKYEPKVLKKMIDIFFEEECEWVKENGYTISIFKSQANRLGPKAKALLAASGDLIVWVTIQSGL